MKYVWISGGGIVTLVIIVLAIGYSLPVKHRGTGESTFNASPDALFALITNVEAFPAWRRGVKTVETIPSTDGRTRFRERSGNGRIAYVIESAEANRRVVTRIDDTSLPFGGTWTYELLPVSGGRTTLRITEDGEIYNPVFRFVSHFFMGYDGTIKTYLADVGRKVGG
jgi:Polyketide cyclase / dehydrase and lipid transport